MNDIQVQITSCPETRRATGVVTVGAGDIFRCILEYSPKAQGAGLSYPWVVYLVHQENIPQRFMTYDGALNELKALTIRRFDLTVGEQRQQRVNDELEEMVEAITR